MAPQRNHTPDEFQSRVGEGGETHQSVDAAENAQVLTTNHGLPVSDNQNSLKAGERGPVLLEDFIVREKIFHFDHERIPERIVHARGSGAHGYFECTKPIPQLTRASLFQEKGHRVPVFVRFSTVAGGAGSVDTPRDVRGFAVKFYTQEGNWDLVGNNIPVFFIQDAIKFPDLVHAVKMESDRGFPQAASAHDTFWDFVSLMPESTHMLVWAMSDRTLPRSLRMMDGFGVHTFRFINAQGESRFVKFHWRPKLGVQSTLWDEAVKLAGADPDFHRRDLWESIQAGDFPEWELGVQTFDEAWASKQPYDVLDATKLIPEEEIPVEIVGRMALDRNPDNFFAEVEQVAFMPSNLVPGIDFSNDPLLQGRLFSYLDTQKSRLGTTNFHQIPINRPKCPASNFFRDGMMQTEVPIGRANYEPNSLNEAGEPTGPRELSAQGFSSYPESGERNDPSQKARVRSDRFRDHYSQARQFYRSQTKTEQAHIATAFVFELSKVQLPHVRLRMLSNLRHVDEGLAERIAAGLAVGLPAPSKAAKAPVDLPPSDALSILKKPKAPVKGRKIGILFSDGSDAALIQALVKSIKAAGATPALIAPRIGKTPVSDGTLTADAKLEGMPSCTLDAIALVLEKSAAKALSQNVAAIQFVADAYAHLKTIGYTEGAQVLLDKANVAPDPGVVPLGDSDFINAANLRHWDREPKLHDLA